MPQKQKKVVIDDRFKEVMDKKSNFNTISKYDKTGKKVKQQDKMMQKFYRIEDKESSKSSKSEGEPGSDDEQAGNKFYDEEGNFQWQGADSSSENSEDQEVGEEGEADIEDAYD
jgi:hypothetical protein